MDESNRLHPLLSVPAHVTRPLRRLGNRMFCGLRLVGIVPAELEAQAVRMDTGDGIDGELRGLQFG